MAEKTGKYAAALAAINQPEPHVPVVLPMKPSPPKGKRSREGCGLKQVLLNLQTFERASQRLKRRADKTDFSDLELSSGRVAHYASVTS